MSPRSLLAAGCLLAAVSPQVRAQTTQTFTGAFYPTDRFGTSTRAVGGISSFIVTRTGAYSVRGSIHGQAFTFKGKFSAQGETSQTLRLPYSPAYMNLAVVYGEDGIPRLQGEFGVSIPGGEYFKLDLVRQGGAVLSSSQIGAYTLLIGGPDNAGTPTLPQGRGVATVSVRQGGAMRAQYILADGTRGTFSSTLDADGGFQFYPQNFTGSPKNSFLTGQLRFRTLAATASTPPSDIDGIVSWSRSFNVKSPIFPEGFFILSSVVGSKYTPPAKGEHFYPGLTGNAAINLNTGAGAVVVQTGTAPTATAASVLATPPSVPPVVAPPSGITVGTDGSISVPATWTTKDTITATGLKLVSNRATGLVTGTYTEPYSKAKLTLYAVMIQNQPYAGGFFKTATSTGYLNLSPVRGN